MDFCDGRRASQKGESVMRTFARRKYTSNAFNGLDSSTHAGAIWVCVQNRRVLTICASTKGEQYENRDGEEEDEPGDPRGAAGGLRAGGGGVVYERSSRSETCASRIASNGD